MKMVTLWCEKRIITVEEARDILKDCGMKLGDKPPSQIPPSAGAGQTNGGWVYTSGGLTKKQYDYLMRLNPAGHYANLTINEAKAQIEQLLAQKTQKHSA